MARIPAAERRRALVEAALRVMVRDGVAAATTRAIVAEADMPLASFHYCFRAKEELLGEVVVASVERILDAVEVTLRPGEDVRSAIREGTRAYWSLVEAEPGRHQITYELTQYALRTPGLEHLAAYQYERYLAAATAFLTDLGEHAGVTWSVPLPVVARMVITVLDGLTLSWLADHDSEQVTGTLDAFGAAIATLAAPGRSRRTA
ncbi:MAG: TetR/AcrR family transcriptional regulator [Streptosporangiaceae bacterium]